MFSHRILAASFSMIALAFAAGTADAQNTGPIKKPGGAPKSMPAVQGLAQELTPDRVVSLLRRPREPR